MERLTKSNRCILGEGPVWDDVTNSLLFVDILGASIYRMDYASEKIEKIDVGQQIGCLALCENGDLLLAMEDGVYRRNQRGELKLAHQPIKIKGQRFNDGKVGPDGSFYVGTTDPQGKGAFYRLKNGLLEELFGDCRCSNGLDWSMDCKKMVYCDSLYHKVEVFDFDIESGTLANRRTLIDIPKEMGLPDGLSMDQNDHIWLGIWDGSMIAEICENGSFGQKISVPAPKTSCCCFAGKDLKDLIITTASQEDADSHPLSGYLFRERMQVAGKKIFRYKW